MTVPDLYPIQCLPDLESIIVDTPSTSGPGGRHVRRPQGSLLDRMADGLSWHWAVIAALALVVLVLCLRDLPDDLAAARGEGLTGTFTAAEDLGCGRSLDTGCSWSGSFVSDDGTIRVDDVALWNGPVGAIGETAHVRYINSDASGVVYKPDGDSTWAWNVAVMVASISYLVGFTAALVKRARRGK